MQHRALDDLARIANQQHAFVAPSFDRHLHAFHHAQARKFLQQRFAFGFVGLDRFRGIDECLQAFRIFPLQLQELISLLGVYHRGSDQRSHQRRGCAQAIEVFEQFLNGRDGEIPDDGPEDFDRAGEISRERVGNSGPAGEFGGAIGKHLRRGIGSRQRGPGREAAGA